MTTMDRQKVEDICRKVQKLQKLTALTGTITKRSQGLLLQSLSPEELLLAADILTEEGQTNGNLNSK